MVRLTRAEYRQRVYGGWLGKLIGAAVGAPGDGRRSAAGGQGARQYLEALSRAPMPAQEGSDFQLVWLRALERAGPKISLEELISAWLRHLAHGRGEYPYALANFRRELAPPASGAFENPFREGLGALARAELWGMVAPGDPERAAYYAYQDAMLDHAGAGVEAAIWLAGMASGAFAESQIPRLIEIGLGLVPEEGRVARAVRDVLRWHGDLAHWARTREMLLRAYSSEEVRDSAICAGLIALSLLDGRGDFERTLATAANCGGSTICTCGASGAVLGLALGADAIPAAWREAIPGEVVAGREVRGLPRREGAAMAAERTCEMGRLVIRSECAGRVQLVEAPPEEPNTLAAPEVSALLRQLAMGPYVTCYQRGPVEIRIDYDGPPTIGYDRPRRLPIGLTNVAARSLDLQARVSGPAGFVVTTSADGITLPKGGAVTFVVTISAPREQARIWAVNPCTLFVSLEDGTEATAPITLVGEALWYAAGPYGEFGEAHAPERPEVLSGEAPLEAEGWRRLSVAEPGVNLLAGLEGEQGTYYLASDLWMPRRCRAEAACRARLRVGCNDGTRVWLNGQEVFSQHEHRPVSPRSADEFEVELREDWNRLVIKMAQCSPRRFLSVALKDLDGQLLVESGNTVPREVS